jgi:aldehyde dehydrogenase (NAD+)
MSAVIEQVAAEASGGNMSEVETVFARLADNVPALSLSTVEDRCARINKLVEVTLKYRQEIREAIREELKPSDVDIDGQLLMIKTEAEFATKNLKHWVKDKPVQGSIMTLGKKSYIHYEAKGMVLVLGTWNAPIAIGLVPAIGAIAAGCAVIIKPSELAPKSSALLKKIVEESCADNEVAVVEGEAQTAQALLAQPFNHIFYIGGHAVGKLVAKAAADHFASITLEMGGKNPTIIDKSADLDEAALKTAWGRMCNGGQACVCPDYVLVDASVVDEFTEKTKAALDNMYNADGKGPENAEEFGRIVNKRHWARIKGLLDDALEKGAELVYGGESNEDDCYIAPTVIRGVTHDMKIAGEEIFGPIMVIMPYQSREEAIAEIRKHPKPLSTYIFAKDREAIDYFIAHTTSGNMVVNHNVIQSGTNANLNFGGVNASGVGRIGGFSTFAECSNARSVVEEGPALMDPKLFMPPYGDKYRKMVDDMLSKPVNIPNAVVNIINSLIKFKSLFSRK